LLKNNQKVQNHAIIAYKALAASFCRYWGGWRGSPALYLVWQC